MPRSALDHVSVAIVDGEAEFEDSFDRPQYIFATGASVFESDPFEDKGFDGLRPTFGHRVSRF